MSKIYKYKTLLGHNGLDFSIKCLKSFVNNSAQEIHLQIFEDGSITEDDKEMLFSALPNCTIVYKAVRDEIVNEKLKKHPSCLEYRNNTNYAQKLFDIILYDEEDSFYVDSDILFIKKFNFPEVNDELVFMADSRNAYSFTPYEIFKVKYPMLPFINSGLFYFPHKLFDLNFIETLLNDIIVKQGLIKKIPWLEQSIWSMLAAKTNNTYYFDYDQIVMAQEVLFKPSINHAIIAVHCIFSLRGPAFVAVESIVPTDNDPYHNIKLVKVQNNLSKISYAIEKCVISLKRRTTTNYFKQNIFKVKRPKNKLYRNL